MDSEAKSKFLSYVLRHRPDEIDLTLNSGGWADVNELIAKANAHGRLLTKEDIFAATVCTDKKRFEISPDKKCIRAIHGHSVAHIDMQYEPQQPPTILYHGTASRFLASINEKGILSAERQYVHLSTNKKRALEVGKRHGKPVLLVVDALLMYEKGFEFFLSDNGIWLTKTIPLGFFQVEG